MHRPRFPRRRLQIRRLLPIEPIDLSRRKMCNPRRQRRGLHRQTQCLPRSGAMLQRRLLDPNRRRWRMRAKFQNRCLLEWTQMHSTQMHKSRRRKRRVHPGRHELRHWNDVQKRCVHQNRCHVVPIRRQLPRISAHMPTQWRLRHIRRPIPRMRRRNSHL